MKLSRSDSSCLHLIGLSFSASIDFVFALVMGRAAVTCCLLEVLVIAVVSFVGPLVRMAGTRGTSVDANLLRRRKCMFYQQPEWCDLGVNARRMLPFPGLTSSPKLTYYFSYRWWPGAHEPWDDFKLLHLEFVYIGYSMYVSPYLHNDSKTMRRSDFFSLHLYGMRRKSGMNNAGRK